MAFGDSVFSAGKRRLAKEERHGAVAEIPFCVPGAAAGRGHEVVSVRGWAGMRDLA